MTQLDRTKAPEIKSPLGMSMPAGDTLMLDNGIPVTVIDSGSQRVHRLTLMWSGGSVEAATPTVANLTAQLLREGSKGRSGEEISRTLERNGAWLKECVYTHDTMIVLHALNSTAGTVFPVIRDMVLHPTFPMAAVDALRENYAGNLETSRKRVDYLSQIEINKMNYGDNHRLARAEMPDMIRSISTEDLVNHHSEFMQMAGVRMFLAGKVDESLVAALNDCFGRLDLSGRQSGAVVIEQGCPVGERMRCVDVPEAMQSSVRMAIPTIKRNHPDYIKLRMAVVALGGYFGSRLMSNIREEKGLTYGINAGLYGYREGAVIMIGAQTANATVSQLVDETRHEMERLASGDMSSDEMVRLKRYLATQLMAQLDTPFAMMDYYENMHVNGISGDYYAQQWQAIESVTPYDIAEMATRYFDIDRIRVAVAGNVSEIGLCQL